MFSLLRNQRTEGWNRLGGVGTSGRREMAGKGEEDEYGVNNVYTYLSAK
jgi:hypothetical protein